ncbi:MAG: hypothetical protein CMI60_07895 [Parvibaculum sp.]|nr:hypothetical protein [Parvibaculum sp.]
MSDIQITISEQENISLAIAPANDSVTAFQVPVVPEIDVVTGGSVTNVFQGGGGAQVLNDLTDVNAGSGASQGQILFYDVNAGEWQKGGYSDIAGIPSLAAIATSGSYNDLTDVPASSGFSGNYNDLSNQPALFDGNYSSLTNTPQIPSELNDLSDVDLSTAAAGHGQVLKFDSASGTFKPADDESESVSGGGGGTIDALGDIANVSVAGKSQYDFLMYNGLNWINANPKIDASIAVTNTDSALGGAVGQTYAAGTDIITILTDILTDYYPTTITLSSLKLQVETTGGSYGATTTSLASAYEAGQGVKVVGFNFSIADNTQTADTSVVFKSGGTAVESSLSDSAFSPNLQVGNVQTVEPTSFSFQSTTSFTAAATDNGGGSDVTITSGSKTIRHQWRYKLFGSSTSSVSTNNEAQTLYDSSSVQDALGTNSQKTLTCGADNNVEANYTWIVYPTSWTLITDIKQNGSIPVLSAFQSPVIKTITNQYGVSNPYYFYRSNDPGAFASGATLEVTF